MSTLAHTTGQPDGPPTLPPIALADEVTGLKGAFAVLAAIRHRDATGERPGDRHQPARVAGRRGRPRPLDPPPHRPVDGRYRLAAGVLGAAQHLRAAATATSCCPARPTRSRCGCSTRSAAATCATTSASRPDAARLRNVDELDAIISGWTERAHGGRGDRHDLGGRRRGRAGLRRRTAGRRPARPGARLLRRGRQPGRRTSRCCSSHAHPRMSRTPGAIRHAGLAPGACTDEVLAELGYTCAEIEALRSSGRRRRHRRARLRCGLTVAVVAARRPRARCRPAPARPRRWCGS